MGAFKKLPTLRPLQDGRWWVLAEPLQYQVNGDQITVPAGFTTDFASIPRFLWWLLPPHGRYSSAAIVHDWLYHTGRYSRRDADRVFLEAMAALGVLLAVRHAMWLAVRVFGWFAYEWDDEGKMRAGCSWLCDPRCARVLRPIPTELRPVRPRGLERLLHWLHGRFS